MYSNPDPWQRHLERQRMIERFMETRRVKPNNVITGLEGSGKKKRKRNKKKAGKKKKVVKKQK